MAVKSTRRALGAALVLSLGVAFAPLGCESWEQPAFTHVHPLPEPTPEDLTVPDRIVKELTRCAEQAPGRSTTGKPDTQAVQFTVHAGQDGRISEVSLNGSTLGEPAVETCMQGALQGMTLALQGAPLRVSAVAPGRSLPPEGRALDAFPRTPLTIIALHPVVVVVAGLIVLVVVYVVSEPIVKAILAPSRSTPVAAPAATAAPAASAARRNANQTCDDEVLDRLQKEKGNLCDQGYAADCSPGRSDKMLNRIPCSKIKLSLDQRAACLKHRHLIQDECFGGVPDDRHRKVLDELERGFDHCKARQRINCAEDHPMADQ